MAYMKDRSLKQIQAGNALNNINVPQSFQTGTYYPPGVQTPPPSIGQMGMGAQMGTAPIAQTANDSTGTTMAGTGYGQFGNPFWKQVANKSDSTFRSKGIDPKTVTFPKSIQNSIMNEGSIGLHKIYSAKGELENQYGISKKSSDKHYQKVDSTLNAAGLNTFD